LRPTRLPSARSLGLLAALAAVAACALVSRRLVRLEVDGLSMVPALAPGDRVLVWTTSDVAVGDVVAIRDPDEPGLVLVKRVIAFDSSSIRVEGDNPGASRDSRHFGPVPRSAVVGKVLRRYSSRFDRPAPGAGPGRLR
jgi:nickel-type superoxide dismutase maturation protease